MFKKQYNHPKYLLALEGQLKFTLLKQSNNTEHFKQYRKTRIMVFTRRESHRVISFLVILLEGISLANHLECSLSNNRQKHKTTVHNEWTIDR